MRLNNFIIQELVSENAYELLGEQSLKLLNLDLIKDIDKFVSELKVNTNCESVLINNWFWNGSYSQSGFRESSSKVGSIKSQHRYGNAFDLKFVGITLDEALEYLLTNQNNYPAITRYELLAYTRSDNKYGGWLHLDGKESGYSRLYGYRP